MQGTGYRKRERTSLRQGRTKKEQLLLAKFGSWVRAASRGVCVSAQAGLGGVHLLGKVSVYLGS